MTLLTKYKLLTIMLSLFLLAACSTKTRSLERFYTNEHIKNVDKVILTDGSTGYTKTITSQEEIDTLLTRIKDIEFSPQAYQEKRVGWRYGIRLFDGNKEFNITLDQIGNTYYDSNPDIFPIIDNYYKTLEVEEK